MSGTKETAIRRSVRQDARQRLAPLLPVLSDLQQRSEQSRSSAADSPQRVLEEAIQALRAELRRFATTGTTRATMLEGVRTADACLSRISAAMADAPTLAQLGAVQAKIQGLIDGERTGDVEDARASTSRLIDHARRAEALRGEAEAAVAAIRRMLATAGGAATTTPSAPGSRTVAGELHERLVDAARNTVETEAALAKADPESLRLGGFAADMHAGAIESARKSLATGDVDGAANHADSARSMRVAAEGRSAEVRQQIEMRDELAAHLASTLEKRNYDQCQAYLQPGSGGDERPLVIYAHNPSGTAHVRLTLALDGGMTVEIDGVADGEEEICIDVLEAFKQAVEESGDEFVVRDAGRATRFIERPRTKTRQREQEREHRR